MIYWINCCDFRGKSR